MSYKSIKYFKKLISALNADPLKYPIISDRLHLYSNLYKLPNNSKSNASLIILLKKNIKQNNNIHAPLPAEMPTALSTEMPTTVQSLTVSKVNKVDKLDKVSKINKVNKKASYDLTETTHMCVGAAKYKKIIITRNIWTNCVDDVKNIKNNK